MTRLLGLDDRGKVSIDEVLVAPGKTDVFLLKLMLTDLRFTDRYFGCLFENRINSTK